MPAKGEKAILGAMERLKERPGNNVADYNVSGWDNHNWPDWDNDVDFTNWENIGNPKD